MRQNIFLRTVVGVFMMSACMGLSYAENQGPERIIKFPLTASSMSPLLYNKAQWPEHGKGLIPEVIQDIFKLMGYQLTIDRLPLSRYVKLLKNGEIKVGICINMKADYLEQYYISPLLYRQSFGVWTHKSNPINDPNKIEGEVILFGLENLNIFSFLKKKNKIVKVPTHYDIIAKSFHDGKVKYVIAGKESTQWMLKQDPDDFKGLELKFLPVWISENHLCWNKNMPNVKESMRQFEETVTTYVESERFKELIERYPYADFFEGFKNAGSLQ